MEIFLFMFVLGFLVLFLLPYLYIRNPQNRWLAVLFRNIGPRDDVKSMTKQEIFQSGARFLIIASCIFLIGIAFVFVSTPLQVKMERISVLITTIIQVLWVELFFVSLILSIKGISLLIIGLIRKKDYVPLKRMSYEEMLGLFDDQQKEGWTESNREKFAKMIDTFDWTKRNKKAFLKTYETRIYHLTSATGIGREDMLNDIITELEMLVDKKGEDPQVYYLKAFAYYFSEYWAPALGCYEKTLQFDPKRLKAWVGAIACLFKLERYEDASQKISEAIKTGIKESSLKKALSVPLSKGEIKKILPIV